MTFPFLNASLSIQTDPKTSFINDFQNALYDGFKTASDWFTIQEEVSFASGVLTDVDVRVNTAIDALTGEKLGDDYKIILFEDLQHATGLGYMYFFDENWWVTINSEIIKNIAATATVKRCNNTLRWKGEDGGVYSFPCSIGYMIKMNRNLVSSSAAVVMPSGYIKVVTQLNAKTNKIRPNQRFLFGNPDNWIGYKITGGGVNNYNNLQTENNTTTQLIELDMEVVAINSSKDDLVNGIADVDQFVYTIDLNNTSLSGEVGNSFQLVATTKLNGEVTTANVIWGSSDDTVAIVSNNGLVTFISAGYCNITCSLEFNSSITAINNVTVSSIPVNDYYIVVSPTNDYVLLNDTQTFSVYLYLNGVQQSDTFTFTIADFNVPASNYVFNVIDGNNFSIENNKMYLDATLNVNSVSGSYSQQLNIMLRGGW